jgi:tetratricopeptide (TPR) repeat protein
MADSNANRPAPTANGTFAKTPFLHLVLYALEMKLSGTMEILSPDKHSAVLLFIGGQPAKVRTSEPVAYLGTVLKDMGLITEEQLTRSLTDLAKEKAAGRKLHGEVLVASGAIDADKLRSGLVEQIGHKLRHVAALPPNTAYAYFDGFDALHGWGGDSPQGTDPYPFLRAMLRDNAPMEHVKAALARVSASALRLARDAEVARLRLSKEETFAVDLLRLRPLRSAELGVAGRLDEGSAEQLSYLLLVTKQVDVVPASEAAPGSVRSRASNAPSARPAPSQSTRSAPPASTRSPAPSSVKSQAPASVAPAPPPERVSLAPAPKAVPPQPGLSVELTGRWIEISERAATIDRADYFMMLDLSRDATHEEVESAFFALAKHWHPDRLPHELAPVREACSRVFARMSEARSTLSDEEARKRYMTLLAEGSGSPEMQESVAKVLEAARDFQKAEICFRRNDIVQAEALCRKATEADPTQADYLALLAWLVATKPESQSSEKTLECIKTLDHAVSLNNRCEKAYFWRAMLFKRLGKTDLATKDFKRVVDLNPRNIDAAREVRLQSMRGGGVRHSSPPPVPRDSKTGSRPAAKGEAAQKGSLFGRLFKKS